MSSSTTLIAHLTDTHVVAADSDEETYVDNNARVALAVASIEAETPAPAAVLATGDLTQWGHAAEYERLAELLAPLSAPVLPLPGNHDERAALRACFPDHPWLDADHGSWVVTIGDVRIVGLDSTLPGEPGAQFDREREAWLVSVLDVRHDGPTILAMHHPPFVTGIEWMDRSGFVGLDRLERVLCDVGGTDTVDRIVCGHMHRPITSSIAGIPADVGLSTAVHVALDLRTDGPISVVRDPAGYRLLAVGRTATGATSIVGHTRYVDTGQAPFTPAWAATH